MRPDQKITVYYDGLCHLCSREIDHYRGQKGFVDFEFSDITAPTFSASEQGLDPVAVHKHMHVRDANGNLHVGVSAFICIWNNIPKYKKYARIASAKVLFPTLEVFYEIFAKIRPFLPKKKNLCAESPYCEINIK